MPDPIIEELRAARINRGFTQLDVARHAPLAQSQVSEIETGYSGVTLATLRRWSTALGYDLRLVESEGPDA